MSERTLGNKLFDIFILLPEFGLLLTWMEGDEVKWWWWLIAIAWSVGLVLVTRRYH